MRKFLEITTSSHSLSSAFFKIFKNFNKKSLSLPDFNLYSINGFCQVKT